MNPSSEKIQKIRNRGKNLCSQYSGCGGRGIKVTFGYIVNSRLVKMTGDSVSNIPPDSQKNNSRV